MATQDEVEELKLILGDCVLADQTLSEIIDAAPTMAKATELAWQRLAADRVTMVNVSEAGSSRSLGDVFKNTLSMAQFAREVNVVAPVRRATVVRKIVRE